MLCCSCLLFKLFAVIGVLVALIKAYAKLTTGWCRSHACLIGKTTIVTGANTGIGLDTAIDLAMRGAKVILACRDPQRAERARARIVEETGNKNIIVKIVDFASFDSVRKFAKDINATEERLDILINNAGIYSSVNGGVSKDKHDVINKVNHYSYFLLTNLLIGLLKKTKNSRVVNVSSMVAKWCKDFQIEDIDKYKADNESYHKSKLCNIFFTKELAKRLEGTSVTTYSLHPGLVSTEITRNMTGKAKLLNTFFQLFAKTSEEGAQTTLYCALTKGIEHYSGEHFSDCKWVRTYDTASDYTLPRKVWEVTERLVDLKPHETEW